MENGYTLFDYNVGLNDIVQLLQKTIFSAEVLFVDRAILWHYGMVVYFEI